LRERWEMDVVGKQASRQIHLLKKKDTANLRPAVNQTGHTAVRTVNVTYMGGTMNVTYM